MKFPRLILPFLLLAAMAAAQQVPPKSEPLPTDVPQVKTHSEDGSSSRDRNVDLSPPKNDAKNHPDSEVDDSDDTGVNEMHPWDPHKAMKNIEVGDYYFHRKNYKAALSRYQEALSYKPNDAEATYKLAESFDKLGQKDDARDNYSAYLKILPGGKYAKDCEKALARLPKPTATNSASKQQ